MICNIELRMLSKTVDQTGAGGPMTTKTEKPTTTDRIEKRFEVKAKRSKVWKAISDAAEFGAWFGVKFDRAFAPGAIVIGRLTITGYEDVTMEVLIEKIEPEGYFSYRWHPYAVDPTVDYTAEPTTLVEFRLVETAGGTAITITESGFDRLPASRRAEAFRMNEAGGPVSPKARGLCRLVGVRLRSRRRYSPPWATPPGSAWCAVFRRKVRSQSPA